MEGGTTAAVAAALIGSATAIGIGHWTTHELGKQLEHTKDILASTTNATATLMQRVSQIDVTLADHTKRIPSSSGKKELAQLRSDIEELRNSLCDLEDSVLHLADAVRTVAPNARLPGDEDEEGYRVMQPAAVRHKRPPPQRRSATQPIERRPTKPTARKAQLQAQLQAQSQAQSQPQAAQRASSSKQSSRRTPVQEEPPYSDESGQEDSDDDHESLMNSVRDGI